MCTCHKEQHLGNTGALATCNQKWLNHIMNHYTIQFIIPHFKVMSSGSVRTRVSNISALQRYHVKNHLLLFIFNIYSKTNNLSDAVMKDSFIVNTLQIHVPKEKYFDFGNYLSCDYVLASKENSDLIPNFIPQTNHWKEFVFSEWPCS